MAYHPRQNQSRRPAAPSPRLPKVNGDPELWKPMQSVTDPASGWTNTTRGMMTGGGVVIKTCTRNRNGGAISEALVLVPGTQLQKQGKYWRIL